MLKIDCLDRRVNFKKIARAVYKFLGQKDKLKAEIIFMEGDKMQELNKNARGVDSITDVLSFPSLDGIRGKILNKKDYLDEIDGRRLFIGSIVLCEQKITEQAKELGHSTEREIIYLTVHGLMHLFGYDHMEEKDKKQMREKEKGALALLGIKD